MTDKRLLDALTVKDNYGEEEYNAYKKQYDDLMHYRKTIKGKPTLEQRIQLLDNEMWIEYLQTILWHTGREDCSCRACTLRKQGINIYDRIPYQFDFWEPMPKHKITYLDKLNKILDEYKGN